MADDWRDYQTDAALFFHSLGMNAQVDQILQGVRTSHAVDVVVDIDVLGFNIRWIVECKLWKTPISKVHVMALREIVSDLGADRGIILCEVGFQSGALEAARLTNVQPTSLAHLSVSARDAVFTARLPDLQTRLDRCRTRYWDLSKSTRAKFGLDNGSGRKYIASGALIIDFSNALIIKALGNSYPIHEETLHGTGYLACHLLNLPTKYNDIESVVKLVSQLLGGLEAKLDAAEECSRK